MLIPGDGGGGGGVGVGGGGDVGVVGGGCVGGVGVGVLVGVSSVDVGVGESGCRVGVGVGVGGGGVVVGVGGCGGGGDSSAGLIVSMDTSNTYRPCLGTSSQHHSSTVPPPQLRALHGTGFAAATPPPRSLTPLHRSLHGSLAATAGRPCCACGIRCRTLAREAWIISYSACKVAVTHVSRTFCKLTSNDSAGGGQNHPCALKLQSAFRLSNLLEIEEHGVYTAMHS